MGRVESSRHDRLVVRWALLSILFLGAFNWFMDPYSVWSAPTVAGVNDAKPLEGQDMQDRLRVANGIRRTKPHAIILGTSTSKRLDAVVYGELVSADAYNAGMTMASLGEVRACVDLAVREQPDLRHVLVALDFTQSRVGNDKSDVELAPPYLAVTDEGLNLLFSSSVTSASISTLAQNISGGAKPRTDREGRLVTNIASGRDSAFRDYLALQMSEKGAYFPYQASPQALLELRLIVQQCQSRGIDVQFLISPLHAAHLEAFYEAGLGDEYEQWVRNIASSAPVWDFSGYNGVTTEPVRDRMQYYEDPLHYTPETGVLMLERIYGDTSSPEGFGVLVTPANVDSHLTELRKRCGAGVPR